MLGKLNIWLIAFLLVVLAPSAGAQQASAQSDQDHTAQLRKQIEETRKKLDSLQEQLAAEELQKIERQSARRQEQEQAREDAQEKAMAAGFGALIKPPSHAFGQEHTFVRNFAADQKAIWSSPLRLTLDDATWIAPFAGITAGLIGTDRGITAKLPSSASFIHRAQTISNYGIVSLAGAGAGMYLWGNATHNDHERETGFLAGEAAIDSFLIGEAIKNVARRDRPTDGNGKGGFFHGGSSFPSEHATAAWSIASVIAHEYPGPLTQLFAYGAASAISFGRIAGRDHWTSDVFIGGALGWYTGYQVYHAHHSPDLPGADWGTFVRNPEATVRTPDHMGSPYVPLDSWIYPVLDRLVALGLVHAPYLGMRPWTRLECAQLLDDARNSTGGEMPGGEASRLLTALNSEFSYEASELGGGRNIAARVESVYTRYTGISGPPVTDGYHFGQTIVNDFGRPYGEGNNLVTGASANVVAGPLAFYVRGEFQHGAAPMYEPQPVVNATSAADFLHGIGSNDFAIPSAQPVFSTNRFRLLDTYAAVKLSDFQLSFGWQSLWLGPGESGPLLYSDNAAPVLMLRASQVSPIRVPLLSTFLGPMRSEFWVGRLAGQSYVAAQTSDLAPIQLIGLSSSDQPYIHGQKVSFKPTPNLEFGMGWGFQFGGPGFPVTWSRFFHSFSLSPGLVNGTNSPGNRQGSFDFTYRVPGLRNWLTMYLDSYTEDEISPVGSNRPALNPGLYFPKLPYLHKLDLRLEGVYTDPPHLQNGISGFVFWNARYVSGLTNAGDLMTNWVGRQGMGEQGWATYWLSSRNKIQFGYRHQQVDRAFLQGGRLHDASVRTDFLLRRDLGLSGLVQYESWAYPLLAPEPKSNITTSIEVTFWPTFTKQ